MQTSETVIFQSAVFIEDGMHHRSIHHKIDPTSLKIYRIYYSRPVRWLVGFVIFINLMLSFFEYPSSLSLSSDYRFRDVTWHISQPPCGLTEGIEILCLLVFLVDCYAKFYLLGWRRFVARPWFLLYAFMVIVSFIDIVISLSFCDHRGDPLPMSLGYTLRIRRFFRPLFFLISSSVMKKFTKAAVLTLPQIFTVLFLLALHVYVFAMLGLLVFPRSPPFVNGTNETEHAPQNSSNSTFNMNYSHYEHLESRKYFDNIFDALTSLLVLLTTANHPDVMIPIYQFNRFSSLYFIIFLGIGAFIILNLLIAATYNQFRGFFQKSLQSSLHRRLVAFRAAFTLLAKQTRKTLLKGNSRPHSNEVVSKNLIRRLLHKARLHSKLIPQMYTKLETVRGDLVDWLQFRGVFDVVFQDSPKDDDDDPNASTYCTNIRVFQWFRFGVRHRFFNYFTYVISLINVILVTIELEVAYDESFHRVDSRLAYYNLFFVIYYAIEQTLKLVGYGCIGYLKNLGNVYEGIVTCALMILELLVIILYDSPLHMHNPILGVDTLNIIIRLMNIFIVLRLLRILVQVNSLKLLVSTTVDLIWNVRGFFGIIVVIYYLFAFLGMELFFDVDGPSDPNGPCQPDYDHLFYYGNNFHDFASSLVTLWDVMVVNNWYIFLDKFACDSFLGKWAKIYFIVWWLVSAIICVNLFISLVLEIFLIKWEAWQKQSLDERASLGDSSQRGGSGGGSQVCLSQH